MSVSGHHIHLATGVDLYYTDAGQGKPTLVFLHGGGGWSEHWQWQLPYCAAFTRVLTCDLRGHGRSATPRGRYTVETFVADLHALLTQLQIDHPILVGHSLGGSVALRYAFDFPDQVAGLAILDSGCGAALAPREGYRALVVARVHDFAAARATLYPYDSSPHSGRADFVHAVLAATPAPPVGVIHATHYGIITHNNAAAAAFITCPVLVLGAADMAYWPSIQSWRDYVPHARLMGIAHSGHYLMLEQPEQVNAALAQFWQDVQTGTIETGEPRLTPPGLF